jgi:micrococcal nuclease
MNQAVDRCLVALALLAALVFMASPARAQSFTAPAYVTRVVDGDTLYAEFGGRLEVVRYLGINTPRIEHPLYGAGQYAMIAREANRQLVEAQWVRLTFEGPQRDSAGRLRAYVWVGRRFVNALLLHHGYAEVPTASTAGYADYFRMLQEGAQRDRRGLWNSPDAITYHRPRPTELAADAADEGGDLALSGGRVFSAPAPFIPSVPAGSSPSYTPSLGVPAGPSVSRPSSSPSPSSSSGPRSSPGSSSYTTPSMRR